MITLDCGCGAVDISIEIEHPDFDNEFEALKEYQIRATSKTRRTRYVASQQAKVSPLRSV